MKKVYIFGNTLVPEDSVPFQYIDRLKQEFPKVKFITVDPNENFPPENEKNLIVLDTVIGIKKPMILNLNDFDPSAGEKKHTPVSPHDYDLLFHLLLLKKLKKIESVKVIGVPFGTTFPTIVVKVVKIISTLL